VASIDDGTPVAAPSAIICLLTATGALRVEKCVVFVERHRTAPKCKATHDQHPPLALTAHDLVRVSLVVFRKLGFRLTGAHREFAGRNDNHFRTERRILENRFLRQVSVGRPG
jgi:hypothetical protein